MIGLFDSTGVLFRYNYKSLCRWNLGLRWPHLLFHRKSSSIDITMLVNEWIHGLTEVSLSSPAVFHQYRGINVTSHIRDMTFSLLETYLLTDIFWWCNLFLSDRPLFFQWEHFSWWAPLYWWYYLRYTPFHDDENRLRFPQYLLSRELPSLMSLVWSSSTFPSFDGPTFLIRHHWVLQQSFLWLEVYLTLHRFRGLGGLHAKIFRLNFALNTHLPL